MSVLGIFGCLRFFFFKLKIGKFPGVLGRSGEVGWLAEILDRPRSRSQRLPHGKRV